MSFEQCFCVCSVRTTRPRVPEQCTDLEQQLLFLREFTNGLQRSELAGVLERPAGDQSWRHWLNGGEGIMGEDEGISQSGWL